MECLVLGDVVLKLFSVIAENISWSWCNRHSFVTAICWRPSWTPETQPNGAVRRRLVEFLVFNSIYLKKSVPSNGINRVGKGLWTFRIRSGNPPFWNLEFVLSPEGTLRKQIPYRDPPKGLCESRFHIGSIWQSSHFIWVRKRILDLSFQ